MHPDRVIFKGHLPICWSKRFMGFLYSKGVLFKNTDKYSKAQGQTIADSIENWAKKLNRPSIYVKSSHERKDDIVRQVLADHPTKSGLVCVIRAVESCYGFRLCYG